MSSIAQTHDRSSCGYEFGWRFEREWVRGGIPWFIFAEDRVTARTNEYNQTKLEFVRARLEAVSKRAYLRAVLSRIIPTGASPQEAVESVVRFVQGATWHNPLECPFESDAQTIVSEAHELLELHDARCWHTAEVVRQLVLEAGWDARITFLPTPYSPSVHVVTEVALSGDWLVLDANYFKDGVILRKPDGSLPSLAWLADNPHYPDCFPGGWIVPAHYLTNAAALPVSGQFSVPFDTAEDTWGAEARYSSYLGVPEWYPPSRPTELAVRRDGEGEYSLRWRASRSFSAEHIRYEVTVRSPDGRSLWSGPPGETLQVRLPELPAGQRYVASVAAVDEQRLQEPHIWYPSTSVSFVVGQACVAPERRS